LPNTDHDIHDPSHFLSINKNHKVNMNKTQQQNLTHDMKSQRNETEMFSLKTFFRHSVDREPTAHLAQKLGYLDARILDSQIRQKKIAHIWANGRTQPHTPDEKYLLY